MVGDRDLRLIRELNSIESSAALVETVWRAGQATAPGSFSFAGQTRVSSDQVPLIAAGIPSCLLIDLDYRPWHTLDDTTEHVSAESLGRVGRTVLAVLAATPN